MSIPWVWKNTTQVVFGENAVKEHMKDFVQKNWKVLCTFGSGSIEKNGAKKDVEDALKELNCEVRWEGGIPANPEYERLVEILKVIREFKPDLLLAIGGGSVIDGTKFLLAASGLPETEDPWDIVSKPCNPKPTCKLGTVLTIPATGSEWNNGFAISRRATHEKNSGSYMFTFPMFSLLDPRYTVTLPIRQKRNGLYDAMAHCIDQAITPKYVPMMDNFFFSVMKELVSISDDVLKPNPSIQSLSRLIQAASFALNKIFANGVETCWAIHTICQQLTALYGIDHAVTLSIVGPYFLEMVVKDRQTSMARAAEQVFDIYTGTDAEKAQLFIQKLKEWIKHIGIIDSISQCEGVTIQKGDIEKLTKMVMKSTNNQPFGYHNCITEDFVKTVFEKSLQ